MPTIDEARARLSALKAQGKTESTSKEAGKLSKLISGMKDKGITYSTRMNEATTEPQGGSSGSSGGGMATDLMGTIKQLSSSYSNAIQPAVSALQQSVTPLKERYDNLIASLKGNQTTAENRQTVTTANELGRRGILPSSGLGEQTITNAVNPITADYTGQIKDVGYQQGADINAINQAIANLQAIASTQGITSGTNLFTTLQQMLEQKNQFNASQDAANKLYEEITKPTSAANIANIYSEINKRNSDDSSNLTTFFEWYKQMFGKDMGGTNQSGANSVPSYFTPLSMTGGNLGVGK